MVHRPLISTVAQLSWLELNEREARMGEISTRKYCSRENSQMKQRFRIFIAARCILIHVEFTHQQMHLY